MTVNNGALLDYQLATSHFVTLRATSTDGSFSIRIMTIRVLDTNLFDVGSIFDRDAAPDQAQEFAATGSLVGINARAKDGDATDSVSYSLDDDAGGRFAIDPTSGLMTVDNGALLDYQSATSHFVTLRATSTDGSFSTRIMTIRVLDTNLFDVDSITDADGAANQVQELSGTGTPVGITALAYDRDSTDSVSYSLADDAGGRFAIDGTTGTVTVGNGGLLDYELATKHTVTIQATSTDGSSSRHAMVIDLTDVDEFDVGPIADTDGADNQVIEFAPAGSMVGITAAAVDGDGTDSVRYDLADNAGGRFAIDPASGVVTVADGSLLDYQLASSHSVIVQATSTDASIRIQGECGSATS